MAFTDILKRLGAGLQGAAMEHANPGSFYAMLERRNQAEQAQEQAAQEQANIADVSKILASDVKRGQALQQLAGLGTPQAAEQIQRLSALQPTDPLRERQLDLQARGLDLRQQDAQADRAFRERQFNQQMQQQRNRLAFDREKFNRANVRSSEGEAISKIPSKSGDVDLLFKGMTPITTGLEKGMQWGVDKEGNRVAVPIPKQASEKATQVKDTALSIIDRLLKNKRGVRANYGVIDQFSPKFSDKAREAQTDLNQLRSIATAENLDLMSGVLSETDIKIISDVAGGGLAKTNTEKGALNALRDMRKALIGSGGKQKTEKPSFSQTDIQAELRRRGLMQ